MTAAALAPADPAGSAVLVTALAASGLDPWMLFAGLVGGLWSLGYIPEPLAWYKRLWLVAISAFVGAWLGAFIAPPLAALAAHWWSWWPAATGGQGMRIAASLVIGLLAHRQIGPALMRKVEEVSK